MSPVVNKDLFRKTWGNFPSGVSVVSFYDQEGVVHGLTANSVCSVSLDPFLVLVCIDHKARSFKMLGQSERFVMNFLSDKQEEECRYFAKSDTAGVPPFKFRKSTAGFPVLDGSIAYMDCKIVAQHLAGDHTIFVGEVHEIDFHGGKPLVFYTGKFTEVAVTAAAIK